MLTQSDYQKNLQTKIYGIEFYMTKKHSYIIGALNIQISYEYNHINHYLWEV